MPENIFLDGLGSFNHNTKNAGAIKWGEFNNAAVNTGSIVLSAVFTGSSVNSGTIGDLMPVYTVSVFQANSGKWESTYSTVAANSSTWVRVVVGDLLIGLVSLINQQNLLLQHIVIPYLKLQDYNQ
jgi:type IV secretory pathway TrbF-like protein